MAKGRSRGRSRGFRWFMASYVGLYLFVHFFLGMRFWDVIGGSPWGALAFGAWSVAMILAPIAAHHLARRRRLVATHAVAYVGYVWMGWSFLFVFVSSALSVVGMGLSLPAHAGSSAAVRLAPDAEVLAGSVAAALTAGIAAWGMLSARRIRTSRVRVETEKLPAGRSVRIAHVSDVHLGVMVKSGTLRRLEMAVAAVRPDVTVATGDVLDAGPWLAEEMLSALSRVGAGSTRFAILGNHEFYAGERYSEGFLERAGFGVLRNRSVSLPSGITVTGLDDSPESGIGAWGSRAAAAVPPAAERFSVVLKHRPILEGCAGRRFDLQLSGHTHGGQVYPFRWFSTRFFPFQCGMYEVLGGGAICVSRGCGTWGPPMRVLSPPEVVVVDVVGTGGSEA